MLATPIGDKYMGDLEAVGLFFCSGILQTLLAHFKAWP